MTGDTLQTDTLLIKSFTESSMYDYQREIIPQEWSFKEFFAKIYEKVFRGFYDTLFDEKTEWLAWGIVVFCLLLVILLIMARINPSLFKFKKSGEDSYDVTDDNIYGVDFDTAIEKALGGGNYREAVRLTYLQHLKWLSDGKFIDWYISKTPTQYTYEVKNDDFRKFTNLFLRVRYGGYESFVETYGESKKLKDRVESALVQRRKGGVV